MDEKETRKLIDKQLQKANWLGQYVKEEVNSVKSDFKKKDYVIKGEIIEKGVDRFIDYLLLAQDNSPLVIIEAKAFSKDPKKGRIQSRTYRADVEKQTGHKITIFLTNGEKWILIDQHDRERKISGAFSQSDLERRKQLFLGEEDPSKLEIDSTGCNKTQFF